jgi:hypothetical protein
MIWLVKRKDADGKIAWTQSHDWKHAVALRYELLARGINSWIEDVDGRRVGFPEITPTQRSPRCPEGLKARNAPRSPPVEIKP